MSLINFHSEEALARIQNLKAGVIVSENGGELEREFIPQNGKVFSLKELQEAVRGHIEIYPHETDITGKVVIVNEEGRIYRMSPNMLAAVKYDIDAVGPVVIIPKDQIE